MKLIIGGRRTGKTTELIKLSAENQYYIICHSQREAERVLHKAKELGFDIPFPLTYDELGQHRYYGQGINGFLIDNLDLFITNLTHVPIHAVTISAEEVVLLLPADIKEERRLAQTADHT